VTGFEWLVTGGLIVLVSLVVPVIIARGVDRGMRDLEERLVARLDKGWRERDEHEAANLEAFEGRVKERHMRFVEHLPPETGAALKAALADDEKPAGR
jgi:hypothetical protein